MDAKSPAPEIVSVPEPVEVAEGETIRLTCKVKGQSRRLLPVCVPHSSLGELGKWLSVVENNHVVFFALYFSL